MKKKISLLIREEGGAITVMTVVMIVAFIGILAVVIDLGHLHTVQSELRNAADACALRGARAFYADDTSTAVEDSVTRGSAGIPQAQALETVKLNYTDTAANPLQVIQDVKIGVWDYEASPPGWLGGTPEFSLWDPTNKDLYGRIIGPGIRLNVNRVGADNYGPVGMTLASLLEFFIEKEDPSVDVRTEATAALSPLGEVTEETWDENGQPPPLQIGDEYAKLGKGSVTLSPDPSSSGSWHSYYDQGQLVKKNAEEFIWGTTQSGADVQMPTIKVGDPSQGTVYRQNGDLATLFQDNNDRSLLNRWLTKTGATIDTKGELLTEVLTPWEVTLPVTSSLDSPYVGSTAVMGFVRVTIDRVYPPNYPDPQKAKTIDITISEVKWASNGKGGGKYYGIIAIDPKLVR
jgi:hypothetical protein